MTAATATNTRIHGYIGSALITIYVLDCARCGLVFGINTDYEARRRDDGRSFHCPNGHENSWIETEAERERARAENALRELDAARKIASNERERRRREERRRAAAQGQVTKIKRRVGNGICPCCSRSFVDLARHMRGQHPEYTAEETTA
ncbi:MAG TPA: hypothetical protein VGK79_00750 [Gaiellaceae bacterium]